MKFQELIILLPCHSLEDFPQHHEGDEAAGLLASWTALWHPALLAAADAAPTWHRADSPPPDLAQRLIVVPSVSFSDLPTGLEERAKDEDACLICNQSDRDVILARALEQLDGGDAGVDPEIARDFLALGYCYLQVQVLTRQMRYSSSLDESHFNEQLLEASKAAVAGELEGARGKLTACFDLLAEERDHYYAVDAFVVDLTLLSEATLGNPLRQELASPTPVNLLLGGQMLAALAEREPATLDKLREALSASNVGLVGGEDVELPLMLMSCESILAEIRRGLAKYDSTLSRKVEIFGRFRSGLTPLLPQILDRSGFRGACHATMDEGHFPEGSQMKTRWEGTDGAAIDALAKAPLDAGKHETFLNLGSKLGESMDMDHVATLWLAHWPSHACAWYEDVKRCSRYGAALGRLITVEEYFRDTYVPGHLDRFEADQYRSPYLQHSVRGHQSNPLSQPSRYWRCRALFEQSQALNTILAALTGTSAGDDPSLAREVDHSIESLDTGDIESRLVQACDEKHQHLAEALPRSDDKAAPGYLLVNPCSFVRRVGVALPGLPSSPQVGGPVYAAADVAGAQHAVVDVPAMGFAWVSAGSESTTRPRSPLPLAEKGKEPDELLLIRNEFFEAWVNPVTGTLQAVSDYTSRGNRLSQQLAFRHGKGGQRRTGGADSYSVMAADSCEITHASTVLGEIVARGRLLDREGNKLAGFQQTFRTWRGSRVLQLEIELNPQAEPGADPWNSYYACRFAWADETAELLRSLHQTRQPASPKRFESPHYVEIDSGDSRTAILTGGMPYHRRVGSRKLDTLLIVQGENQRRFQLGIGVDLKQPLHEATGMLTPHLAIPQTAPPPSSGPSGWFFHLDSRSVIATHWSPITEDDDIVGFRTRLLETNGRSTKVRLSSFRPVASARQVNFVGEALGDCRIKEGRVVIDLAAREWIELEARWS